MRELKRSAAAAPTPSRKRAFSADFKFAIQRRLDMGSTVCFQ